MLDDLDEFRLTAEQLKRAGKLLFGDQWQGPMARLLKVDARRIRDWLQGRRPIPIGIKREVIGFLNESSIKTGSYANELLKSGVAESKEDNIADDHHAV